MKSTLRFILGVIVVVAVLACVFVPLAMLGAAWHWMTGAPVGDEE